MLCGEIGKEVCVCDYCNTSLCVLGCLFGYLGVLLRRLWICYCILCKMVEKQALVEKQGNSSRVVE